MSNFADPQFTHHKALGLLWTKLALTLSNTPVLPFDPRHYAIGVHEIFENLEKEYGATLIMQGIRLGLCMNNKVHGLKDLYPVQLIESC